MVEVHLNAEQEGVIAKVEKLLALARNNPNEHEAESAANLAMKLLEAYNLDMAVIGKTPKGDKRSDTKLKGGLYSWQRNIWNATAELNFCRYWFIRGLQKGQAYEHRILGRAENVTGTKIMAEYLQETIERLAVEHGKKAYPGASRFIRELIIYREGIAYRLAERLRALRNERLSEERRKAEEAATRPSHGGFALVLASVIQTEDDLNEDYLNGLEPGTTGKRRAEQAVRQAQYSAEYKAKMEAQQKYWDEHPAEYEAHKKAQQALYDKWAKEDAAKAKRRKTAVDRPERLSRAEQRMRSPEFWSGYDKGNDVGLDRQIDGKAQQRIAK